MLSSLMTPAFEQALLCLPLMLGIYLSYRILNVTDLTVDGTFVLGAGVFAKLITTGTPEYLAASIAIGAGAIAGYLVAMIQRVARIDSLIASILMVYMLYSINLTLMGRPNISLIGTHTLFNTLYLTHPMLLHILMISIPLFITITFCLFLHTRFGLKLRAMGVNPTLLQRLKQPTDRYLGIGLAISNALAAASGVLTAEVNNYADINMGLGMALTAIGSIIIGLTLIHRLNPLKDRFYALIDGLGSFSGIFLYFLVMNVLIVSGLPPIHLKLLLGITLIVFLGIAQRQKQEARI